VWSAKVWHGKAVQSGVRTGLEWRGKEKIMLCGNEVFIGGPPDADRDICWNLASTECLHCGMPLCWKCAESCYQCGFNLCPGCLTDHAVATDHQVDFPAKRLADALDSFTDRVLKIAERAS